MWLKVETVISSEHNIVQGIAPWHDLSPTDTQVGTVSQQLGTVDVVERRGLSNTANTAALWFVVGRWRILNVMNFKASLHLWSENKR